MNVYSLTAISSAENLAKAITEKIEAKNYLRVTDTLWFVADTQPLIEFCNKLGVKTQDQGTLTGVIVLQVFVYWGHASVNTWQWLASKIEEKPNG